MSEPSDPVHDGDGELLSAYLDGDLDEAAQAAVEARLRAEPALAARLEDTRRLVETLAGLRAEPPAGYRDRLDARLASERAAGSDGAPTAGADGREGDGGARGAPAGADGREGDGGARGAPAGDGGALVAIDQARARRGGGRPRWAAIGAVAAAVAGVAVLGGVLAGGLRSPSDMEFAAEEPADGEAGDAAGDGLDQFSRAESRLQQRGAPVPGAADGGAREDTAEAPPPQPAPPVVVDSGQPLAGGEDVRAHFAGLPEAEGLLGVGAADADSIADRAAGAIRDAEPFASGAHPGACLDAVTSGADRPVVPARVESVVHDGEPALAYVLVRASAGSAELDRVELWLVTPAGCSTRLFQDLSPR